jgi:4,5-dihydroxyphthalate decarboxylase
MLERGEIDAFISADAPKAILEGSPKVGRLFEDYEAVERYYYRRTGIFPIMHTVVVTRELADEHPNLVKAVYCTAKNRMQEQYVKGMTFNNMSIMLPWFSNLIDEDRALLGEDWWPYGVQRNRSAIDVVLRYHHEQGLTKRRLTIERLTGALLDRLTHHVHILEMNGESYRLAQSKHRSRRHSETPLIQTTTT